MTDTPRATITAADRDLFIAHISKPPHEVIAFHADSPPPGRIAPPSDGRCMTFAGVAIHLDDTTANLPPWLADIVAGKECEPCALIGQGKTPGCMRHSPPLYGYGPT